MNYIWFGIIAFSFVCSILTGNTAELSKSVLDAAVNAVNIALRLLATMCLWNGLMEIAVKSGLTTFTDRLIFPVVKLIFPGYSKTQAASAICSNITANLLGLGNAATPAGIEAMRRMKKLSGGNAADSEMIRFVILNSAAITLIPTSVSALRAAAGSSSPFSVLIPVWCTGITALCFGLLAEKLLSKRWKK